MPAGSFKVLENDFNVFLDSIKIQTSANELTPELREKRRKKADKSDLDFCRIYFPKIFNEPFNDIHRHIAGLEKGNYTVSGARRFGKSAFSYIAKIVKYLALGKGGVVNITLRTLIPAQERTAMLVRIMKRNKKLMYDYDIKIQQNKKGFYIVNNTYFVATSVETGLRALVDDEFKRFRVSVNDDLYNKNTVVSEYDNSKVTDFIQSEIYGQMENDGLSITLGNSINNDCPIVRLKEENPAGHFGLPATDESGHTNWKGHSQFTDAFFADFKTKIPYDIWMGEYMDQPLLKGEIFNPDWIRFIYVNKVSILACLTAVDPSFGKSPSACSKGAATLALTSSKEIVMLDIYDRKEDYQLLFDYIDAVRTRFPNWKILLFENDFSQWKIAEPYYNEWSAMRHKSLPVQVFSAKSLNSAYYAADKESRIMNLVYPHQSGKFLYNEDIMTSADFKNYKAQLIGFGKAKIKLDALDATATAFIMLPRYISESGNIKSLKERKFKQVKLWH